MTEEQFEELVLLAAKYALPAINGDKWENYAKAAQDLHKDLARRAIRSFLLGYGRLTKKPDDLSAALTLAYLRHIKEVVETKLDKAKRFGAATEWSEGFQSAFIDLIDEIDHLIRIHEQATALPQNANSETENPF